MMRIVSWLVFLAFATALVAPAITVGLFLRDRDSIARELCVQRAVPEQERTCHGQCCLMKRLHQSNERTRDLPNDLRGYKLCDVVNDMTRPFVMPPKAVANELMTLMAQPTLEGHHGPGDPVPWG